MSALSAAFDDLTARCHAAHEAGDWQERAVLGPLATIADHTKRVGDHPDPHYRADKAGPLLDSAILLQREVFGAYAGWPDDTSPAGRRIVEATDALTKVADAVRRVLWDAATAEFYGEPATVYLSTVQQLTDATGSLRRLTQLLAAKAVRDPEEQQ